MSRKITRLFLFVFSSVLIIVSGYQCAIPVSKPRSGSLPIDPVAPLTETETDYCKEHPYSESCNTGLVKETRPSHRCPERLFQTLADRHGEMGEAKLYRTSLEDYKFGSSINFFPDCARVYLDMNKTSENTYKGTFTLAYREGSNVHYQEYKSGYSIEENKHNYWTGKLGRNWTRSKYRKNLRGLKSQYELLDKHFNAIFENEDTALIFRITEVRADSGKTDGKEEYYAFGKIYYKMFRYSRSAGENDPCYKDGVYMKYFKGTPLPRRKLCWLLPIGPFNCRPEGSLDVATPFKDVDIRGDLPCYEELGLFRTLNIKGAFNVDDIKEIEGL